MARVEAENGIKRPRAKALRIRRSSGQGPVVLKLHVRMVDSTRGGGNGAWDYLSDSLHRIVGHSNISSVQRTGHGSQDINVRVQPSRFRAPDGRRRTLGPFPFLLAALLSTSNFHFSGAARGMKIFYIHQCTKPERNSIMLTQMQGTTSFISKTPEPVRVYSELARTTLQ